MKRVSPIWTRLLWGFHSVVHKLGEELSWEFYVILLFLQTSLHPGNKIHLFSNVSPPLHAMVPLMLLFGTVESVQMRKKGCDVTQSKHYSGLLQSSIWVSTVAAAGLLHWQEHDEAIAVKYLRFIWRLVCALLCSGLWHPERWILMFREITLLQRRWYPVTGIKQYYSYSVQMYISFCSWPL